jgi:hypothetical protein
MADKTPNLYHERAAEIKDHHTPAPSRVKLQDVMAKRLKRSVSREKPDKKR